jgi:hypothetical protein
VTSYTLTVTHQGWLRHRQPKTSLFGKRVRDVTVRDKVISTKLVNKDLPRLSPTNPPRVTHCCQTLKIHEGGSRHLRRIVLINRTGDRVTQGRSVGHCHHLRQPGESQFDLTNLSLWARVESPLQKKTREKRALSSQLWVWPRVERDRSRESKKCW